MIRFSDATATARAQTLINAIDAAATPGKLRVYAGALPATTDTEPAPQDLLVELELATPCGTANNIGLTFNAATALVLLAGTPIWARLCDGDDNPIADFDIGDLASSAHLRVSNLAFLEGAVLSLGNTTLSEP